MDQEIQVQRLPPYTLVFNSIIQDSRLRLPVRAVLILMLSTPPDWDFSVRGMAKIAGVNKDTMTKMIKELEEAGYVTREDQSREDGRFAHAKYIIQAMPDNAPCPKISDTENSSPCPKKPCPKNSDEINKQEINNIPPIVPQGGRKRQYKAAPDWKPERFAGLWRFYPRGENKQAAIRAWDRLRPDDSTIDRMAKALQRQKRSKSWQEGIGIPHLATWLNGHRWEDEDKGPVIAGDSSGGWAPDLEVI